MMNFFKSIFEKRGASPNEKESEVAAVIAVALGLYESECIHDKESYVITIRKR